MKENGVVRGAYSLLEPDGTTRIVEYIADDDGFRAVVKKIGTSIHPTSPVIVQPARLAHVTSLYDHSSGVYAGTKENYIAAYQPRPVLYQQDHSAESVVDHSPLDDEVRIFFNNHDNLVNTPEIQTGHFAAPQPHINYAAPNEYVQIDQPEFKAPQIFSVDPKVYYEPQQQIVAQAPLLEKVQPHVVYPEQGIHQPIQHQIIREQPIQKHILQHQQPIVHQIAQGVQLQLIQEAPLQHQLIHEAPLQQQLIHQAPLQHQLIQKAPLQQQLIHESQLQHQLIQEAPLQHQLIQEAPLQHQLAQEAPRQHQIIHKVPIQQQIIQEVPIQQHQIIQGQIGEGVQQAYDNYQPKIAYQNEPIYEQLPPIPYKTITSYKQQPHQNVGYDYDSY